MVYVYTTNITWTTPLVDYEPTSAWPTSVSTTNGTTASFKFLGNGVKWFGAANSSSYTVQLNANGQPVGPETIGNPRSYQQSAELPSTIACDNSTAWGCKVLAEFSDLTDNVQYEVVLTTLFEGDTTGNKLDLLATQVLRNTTLPDRAIIRNTAVAMSDSRLSYAGDWKDVTYDTEVYRVGKTPGSTITLPFKGYALRIWGTTDITTSSFSVSLDGTLYNVSTPTSNSPDANCLFWATAGLDQTKQHTAILTNTGSTGLIVRKFDIDRLIDPLNPEDDTGGSNTGNNTDTNTGNNTGNNTSDGGAFSGTPSSTSKISTGAIAGIAIGIAALFLIAFALFWWRRTKRKQEFQTMEMAQPAPLISTTTTPYLYPQTQHQQNSNAMLLENSSQNTHYPKQMGSLTVPGALGVGGAAGTFLDGQRRPSSSSQNSNLNPNQQVNYSGPFAVLTGTEHHKPPLNPELNPNTNYHEQYSTSGSSSSPSHRPHASQADSSAYISPHTNTTNPTISPINALSPTQTSTSGTQITSSSSGNGDGGDGMPGRSYTPPPAYESQLSSSQVRVRPQQPTQRDKSPSAFTNG